MATIAIGWALALGACGGSARYVVRDDEGGLFSLEGDEALAHEDAIRQMREHCGAGGYRVVYDGTATTGASSEHIPTQDENAARMALPSDLPGSLEPTGTSPSGGAGVTFGGELFAHDPSRADRVAGPGVDHRRRLEYECNLEEDADAHPRAEAEAPPDDDRIEILATRFSIGSLDDEPGRDSDEGPSFEVRVGAFRIDQTPVSVADFEAHLDALRAAIGDAATLPSTPEGALGECNLGSDRHDHPINCVPFAVARAYCQLVGGDLPTEAELELATRGGANTAYWWGQRFDETHAVSSASCGARGCLGGTAEIVREGPRCNASGICDASGNVWEWTLTEHHTTLGEYVTEVPALDAPPAHPVMRGGAWLDEDPARLRSAFRGVLHDDAMLTGVGFRCVVRD